jgi:hypothetical protein
MLRRRGKEGRRGTAGESERGKKEAADLRRMGRRGRVCGG